MCGGDVCVVCAIFASKNSDMRFFSTCDFFPAGSPATADEMIIIAADT